MRFLQSVNGSSPACQGSLSAGLPDAICHVALGSDLIMPVGGDTGIRNFTYIQRENLSKAFRYR